jgi:hypothetical protein
MATSSFIRKVSALSEGDVRFLDRGYASRIPRDEKELRVSLSTRWKKLLERIGLRKPKNVDRRS